MHKLAFIDSHHPNLQSLLEEAGFSCDLLHELDIPSTLKLLPDYEGIVLRSRFPITKSVIDTTPKLKCIARAGSGMENIDTNYAESKGISCLNAPEGNRDAVAEHALGMLLMLFNNLKRADQEVREGKWKREENRGQELRGKCVGIIGFGFMGGALAHRLRGFGVKVLAYDKYKTGFGNSFIKECTLEQILNETDVLTLHLPESPETKYWLNDKLLNSFRKPIYIVNTSRGTCLSTTDLIKHLKTGKVLGACLDVLEYENSTFTKIAESPDSEDFHFLLKSENVVFSPHIAGLTFESDRKIAEVLAKRIIAAFQTTNLP